MNKNVTNVIWKTKRREQHLKSFFFFFFFFFFYISILVLHVTAPTNHDLMSLMMTRLGALEARVAQQANELAAKVRKSELRS